MTYKGLKRHRKVCESALSLHECRVAQCEKKFGTTASLYKHRQRDHEGDIDQNSTLGVYKCSRCDYSATSQNSLRIHVKRFSKSGMNFLV